METIFIKFYGTNYQIAFESCNSTTASNLKRYVVDCFPKNVREALVTDFYLCRNGHTLQDVDCLSNGDTIHVCPRLRGGKGGFGSMLRAIGAQIEKTTNREACRDLSGRRLRDINEEMRLKKWIAKQTEQKQDKVTEKIKALEKKLTTPKHEFSDVSYDKERSVITDRVNDAVAQGLSNAKSGVKRSASETTVTSKKPKLWLGIDEELGVSDTDSDGSTSDEEKSSDHKEDSFPSTSQTSTQSCSSTHDCSGDNLTARKTSHDSETKIPLTDKKTTK